MRAAAALLLAAACLAGGFCMRARLQIQANMLRQISLLYREIGSRMEYFREPFAALVHSLSQSTLYASLPFLSDCAKRCARGQPFPAAWEEASRRLLCAQLPAGEVRRTLPQLGHALVCANTHQAQRLLEMYEHTAVREWEQARQRAASGGRLCLYAGAAFGVLLGILIV